MEEHDGSEAGELFVCDLQLSERLNELLLDPERHSGHLHLCASQGDHKVVSCSTRVRRNRIQREDRSGDIHSSARSRPTQKDDVVVRYGTSRRPEEKLLGRVGS